MPTGIPEIDIVIDEVPIKEMTFDLNIQFSRKFKLRYLIGMNLIRLVGLVWNCDILIRDENGDVLYETDNHS